VRVPHLSWRELQPMSHLADDWYNGLSDQTRLACSALEDFLGNNSTQVAELKGEWGVGKTHFWSNFVEWSLLHGKLKHLRAHSYVSLFGASSIASLESAIFSAHQPLEETAGAQAAALGKPVKAVVDQLKQASLGLGVANFSIGTASSLVDGLVKKYYLRNFLICFDDIERMDPKMSPSNFLGLVSQLKEQQGCKIVLIYNYDKLARNTRLLRAVEEYREKIIDLELSIRPTVQENLEVAWPKREGRAESYERIFIASGCSNIRIMKRARWVTDYFINVLSDQWPGVGESIQIAIAALAVIHYGNKDLFPDSKAILEDDFYQHLAAESQLYRNQSAFLTRIGYCPAPHHSMILDFFRHGIVDLESYKGALRVNDVNERLARFNSECEMISQQFRLGFYVSQEKLLGDLQEFLAHHSGDISIRHAFGAAKFLQSCGVEVDPALLEKSIESHMEREPELDIYSMNFRLLPDSVREDVKNRYEAKGSSQSISLLLQRLAGSSVWNQDEIRLLRGRTEDEWFEWIANHNGEHETESNGELISDVFHLVGTFLDRFQAIEDEADKATLSKIGSALERLRSRSSVDRQRVECFFDSIERRC